MSITKVMLALAFLMLPSPLSAQFLSENFEASTVATNWEAATLSSGTWTYSGLFTPALPTAAAATKVWTMQVPLAGAPATWQTRHANFNYSPTAANYSIALISPTIDLTTASTATLLEFELGNDGFGTLSENFFEVWVSANGGTNWTQAFAVGDNGPVGGTLTYSAHSLTINTVLAAMIGSANCKLAFVTQSAASSFEMDNWRLDNIRISDPNAPSLAPATGSGFVGFTYNGGIGTAQTNATLLATDANTANIDIAVSSTNPVPGVTAPTGGTGVAVPATLSWTGTPSAVGTFTYLVTLNDGAGPILFTVTFVIKLPGLTLGNVTATTNTIPFNNTGGSARFQSAYSASEINMPAGTAITEIRVAGSIVGVPDFGTLRCGMAHTAVGINALTTTFANNHAGFPLQIVLGPVTYRPEVLPLSATQQWYVFKLSTPFIYNGTSNVLVDWSFSTRSSVGFGVGTAAPTGESPRSRVYTTTGNFTTTTGTASAGTGNYGIHMVFATVNNVSITEIVRADTLTTLPVTDLVALSANAIAVATSRDITSITFVQTGSISDAGISSVALVNDVNGSGVVDAGDATLATGTLTGGQVTFTGTPLVTVTDVGAAGPTRLLLTVTIPAAQAAGTSLRFELTDATDVAWSGGFDLTGYPIQAGSHTVPGPATSFPYVLGFESQPPYFNGTFVTAAGGYPTVVTVGGTPGSGGAAGVGSAVVLGTALGSNPNSGTGLLDMAGATNIGAVALDLRFDMSAVPMTSLVEVEFYWNDEGLDVVAAQDALCGVFISTNNGAGWQFAAFQIPTGTTEGVWNRAFFDLTAMMSALSLTYTNQMVIRFQMAQDSTADHLLLDDIRVDVPPAQLRLNVGAAAPSDALAGATDRLVGSISSHSVNSAQALNTLMLTQNGSVANTDLTNLKLWQDTNSDGLLNAGDTQLGSTVTMMTGNTVTFAGAPLRSYANNELITLFLTAQVSATATLPASIQFSVVAATDVSAAPGFVNGTFPINMPVVTVVIPVSTFPYVQGFESAPPYNEASFKTGAQTVPTVVTVGGAPGSATTSGASGFAVTAGPIAGSNPNTGAGMLDMFGNTNTGATSLNIAFEMSSFSLANWVELEFFWNDEGMDTLAATDAMQGVFLSTNGGQSWEAALFQFNVTLAEGVWRRERINLSPILSGLSLTYTSQMIIRFQIAENSTADHLLLDDIRLESLGAQLRVEANLAAPSTVTRSGSGDQWVGSFDAESISSAQQVNSVTMTQVGTVANSALTDLKLWVDSNADGVFSTGDTQLGSTQAAMTGAAVTFTGSPLGSFAQNQAAVFFLTSVVGNAASATNVQFQVTAASDVAANPGAVTGVFPVAGPAIPIIPPPLSGTITVANGNPGAAFSYGDIGQVFDDLEAVGLAGPLVIELYDDGGAFTPSDSYRLGVVGATFTIVAVPGISATNTVTIRAASGETPVITGSGAVNTYSSTQSGAMAFRNVGNITLDGLTINGAIDFGVMWYSSVVGSSDNIVIRNCRFHAISAGSAIFMYGSGTTSGPNSVLIENNMMWNVHADTTWFGGGRMGVIGTRRVGANFVVRHNSILMTSTGATAAVLQGSGSAGAMAEVSYNAVYMDPAGSAAFFQSNDSAAAAPTIADRNVIFLGSTATMSNVAGLTTWADWQTSGRDVNGLNANPLFVSVASGNEDLHLHGFSQAIDLAVGSTTATDVDGQTRPIGANPDSGADERPALPQPEVDVQRSATSIADGGTDNVGNVPTQGSSFTWTILNTGPGDLSVTTPISVTPGTGAPAVNVTSQPANTVANTTGSTTFIIQITPAQGAFDFVISIVSDDVDESPYNFTVSGTGIGPEIDITRTASIPNGGVDNVGNVSTAGGTFVWTISNSDLGDLTITTPVSITPGTGTPAVNVTAQPGNTVTQGNTTTLAIQILPAVGAFDFLVSITSNDSDENPYQFTVQGSGFIPNGPAVANPAGGSSFSGAVNGPFTQALIPGATLANAEIELTDPDSDTITVTAITLVTSAPTGITAPGIPGAGHPIVLAWSGTAAATNPVGDYTWQVTFEDAVTATPVTIDVTITIGDLPPTHMIAGASGGDGSAATPYTAEYTQTMGSASDINLASVTDPNTGQALNLGTITPGGANPAGGAGFVFLLTGGFLNVAPSAALAAADVGTHTFDIDVTDGANTTTIAVLIAVAATPTITTASPLPNGEQGQLYSPLTLTATGGTGTLTFAVSSGAVPPGLSVSAAGDITGTATTQGVYNFTVTATDTLNVAGGKSFTITINPPALGNPSIGTTTLPGGTVGTAYGPATIAVTGGTAPYSFAVTGGSLPGGLTLNAATGDITGTPTTAEMASFEITVTDSAFASDAQTYLVTIMGTGGGNNGGGNGGGGGGCAANEQRSYAWLLLLGGLPLLAAARRLREVQD